MYSFVPLRCLVVLGVALLVVSPFHALAQSRLPPGVRGPAAGAATRSVAAYLDLERGLIESLKNRDREAVLRVLADGFEVRSASDRDAMSATDWLQQEMRGNDQAAAIVHDLSVREFDDIAVVSFLLDTTRRANTRPGALTLYIIDVWRQSTHQLLVRYVSQPRHAVTMSGRPNGRE